MNRQRNFLFITAADLLARSAYQMGKTPLLPIFAVALGASDTFLGLIVSVSTFTGMVLKPFIGIFSDRWGRRGWLIAGTIFFALMPFLYRFVHSPEQLFAIRIVHGLATAIYGPVTLAMVVEQSPDRRAERLGLFGMARSAGYIIGPAAAGWMLLTMDPAAVFTVIGILSSLVFVPVLALPKTTGAKPQGDQGQSLLHQIRLALRSSGRTPAIWLSGGLEGATYVALYATKAFLPVYALASGVSVAAVGGFFALQEAVLMVARPAGGRFGDKKGYRLAIALGMVLLGLALPALTYADGIPALMGVALLTGIGQALIFPSTTALVSVQISGSNLGAGMGLRGTLRNAGKVSGPILGGILIQRFDYGGTFHVLGVMLLMGAALIWFGTQFSPRMRHRSRTEPI